MVVLPQDTRAGAALEKHSESGEQVCGAGDERERHSSIALLPLMLDRPVEEPGQSTALGQAYRQVALPSVCLALCLPCALFALRSVCLALCLPCVSRP